MGCETTSRPLSILVLQALPSISHHIWAVNLVKGLLREGHHVHVVSILETKIEGKLAQNLTYAVSRCYNSIKGSEYKSISLPIYETNERK